MTATATAPNRSGLRFKRGVATLIDAAGHVVGVAHPFVTEDGTRQWLTDAMARASGASRCPSVGGRSGSDAVFAAPSAVALVRGLPTDPERCADLCP
jgi:hypothetical protein